MSTIIRMLHWIDSVDFGNNSSNPMRFRWHGDIKPENILEVQQCFKLADAGDARIRRAKSKKKKKPGPQTQYEGGGQKYGEFSKSMTKSGIILTRA